MDLTDKQIKITMVGTRHNPPSTTAEVDVLSMPNNGVRQKLSMYELVFEEQTFAGPDDPALMAAVVSKLEAI
jgi:hypothetical protein